MLLSTRSGQPLLLGGAVNWVSSLPGAANPGWCSVTMTSHPLSHGESEPRYGAASYFNIHPATVAIAVSTVNSPHPNGEPVNHSKFGMINARMPKITMAAAVLLIMSEGYLPGR